MNNVYSDVDAVLQKLIPPGFSRPDETTDQINARYIEYLHAFMLMVD